MPRSEGDVSHIQYGGGGGGGGGGGLCVIVPSTDEKLISSVLFY